MVKRKIELLKNQAKVVAISKAYDNRKIDEMVRLMVLALAAILFYFFGFFFSFTLGARTDRSLT